MKLSFAAAECSLVLLLVVCAGGVPFSFKFEDGLCRELTAANQEACCTDAPSNPEGTVFPGKLVVGLGPRKTGTTMLFSLLQQSKDIEVPLFSVKETHFFSTGVPTEVDLQKRNGTLKEYMAFWGNEDHVRSSDKWFIDMSSDYFRVSNRLKIFPLKTRIDLAQGSLPMGLRLVQGLDMCGFFLWDQ